MLVTYSFWKFWLIVTNIYVAFQKLENQMMTSVTIQTSMDKAADINLFQDI